MPGQQQNSLYFSNDGRRTSSESYRLNGDCMPPDNHQQHQRCSEDERMLLQLFKEHPDPTTTQHHQPDKHNNVQHHQQQQHGSMWANMSAAYNSPHNPYVPPSNSYVGGPNITPNYNQITGGFLEDKNTQHHDSSSSSESESSHGSSHQGSSQSQGRSSSAGIRMNKDEKLAREAGIKLDIKQDIVDPPMDEFNDMLSKEDLTEEQLNICRDIRRRGKNKVAAQNCRKRKLEQIDELQKKVDEAKHRQQELHNRHKMLLRTYTDKAKNFIELKETILNHHQKSSQFYEVLVDGDNVRVVRKDEVPKHQLYPKPLDSLLPSPEDPFINGNSAQYNLNHQQHHPFFDRAWEQNNL